MKYQYTKPGISFVVSIVVFISGCSSYMAPTPARDILYSHEVAPDGFGAYGYLIFRKRPHRDDSSRYAAICDAFIRNLQPVGRYPRHDWNSIMPTYWPIDDSIIINEHSPDCTEWIGAYDYARASTMASSIKKLASEGPILVAWSRPFEKTTDEDSALVLDLSDFMVEDFDRAIGIWMDRITRDPKVWNEGFNLLLAREAFRTFLEKYGEHIMTAIKTVKEMVG